MWEVFKYIFLSSAYTCIQYFIHPVCYWFQCSPEGAVDLYQHELISNYTSLAVVGCGCSSATEELGKIVKIPIVSAYIDYIMCIPSIVFKNLKCWKNCVVCAYMYVCMYDCMYVWIVLSVLNILVNCVCEIWEVCFVCFRTLCMCHGEWYLQCVPSMFSPTSKDFARVHGPVNNRYQGSGCAHVPCQWGQNLLSFHCLHKKIHRLCLCGEIHHCQCFV